MIKTKQKSHLTICRIDFEERENEKLICIQEYDNIKIKRWDKRIMEILNEKKKY